MTTLMTRIGTAAIVAIVLPISASALTLEELAARMERLEKKVEAYEKRYGPLDEARASAPRASHEATPASAATNWSKGGLELDDAESIDRIYEAGETGSVGDNWWERTHLGGYGEMHLNLVGGGDNTLDFHRWVLFLNHRFNDRITFNSELELEHSLSGAGKNGEVELEQAYLDFAFANGLHAKGGLFLLPVGIMNETHEPDTFFGVERNPIEKEIIPTTWWEGGLGLSQSLENGFSWDVAVHSGLNVSTAGNNAYRIRSGRQKVSNAPANEPAVTARVRYTGIPGVDLSIFGNYQNDITQAAGTEDNSAYMVGAAAKIQRGGFGLRGLIAGWDIDGSAVAAMGRDQQWGFYLEPSYTMPLGDTSKAGIFGRWNWYEFARGEVDQYDAGINFWPVDNVVFKADYSRIIPDGGKAEDVFNLGVGYSF